MTDPIHRPDISLTCCLFTVRNSEPFVTGQGGFLAPAQRTLLVTLALLTAVTLAALIAVGGW